MHEFVKRHKELRFDHCYPELKALVEDKKRVLEEDPGKADFYRDLFPMFPDHEASFVDLDSDCVTIGRKEDIDDIQRDFLDGLLRLLPPWRKGPFNLFGIDIDTEWRSNIKWNRIKDLINPLKGRRVLDIGCSSGYYMFKMAPYNPGFVLGIDPFLTFYYQFLVLQKYAKVPNLYCIPAKLEDLPPFQRYFDTVFCMGILYHRKSPIETLKSINRMMKKGGELVLETLIIEGEEEVALFPEDRYAKMTNVYFFPTIKCLTFWLKRAGFSNIRCVDISKTTTEEQRRTEWINAESLGDFLDPADPNRTVEGYPAPIRAVMLADA